MKAAFAAPLSFGAVTLAQFLGGRNRPSPDQPRTALWYARLRKPSFTPPGPVFAIAWTTLDALSGYAGYRLLRARSSQARTVALACWCGTVLGVAGFSFVLFGRKRLDEATGVSAAMLAASIGTVAAAAAVDKRAAVAGLPLMGWTGFALVLQEEVWRRNSR